MGITLPNPENIHSQWERYCRCKRQRFVQRRKTLAITVIRGKNLEVSLGAEWGDNEKITAELEKLTESWQGLTKTHFKGNIWETIS